MEKRLTFFGETVSMRATCLKGWALTEATILFDLSAGVGVVKYAWVHSRFYLLIHEEWHCGTAAT